MHQPSKSKMSTHSKRKKFYGLKLNATTLIVGAVAQVGECEDVRVSCLRVCVKMYVSYVCVLVILKAEGTDECLLG